MNNINHTNKKKFKKKNEQHRTHLWMVDGHQWTHMLLHITFVSISLFWMFHIAALVLAIGRCSVCFTLFFFVFFSVCSFVPPFFIRILRWHAFYWSNMTPACNRVKWRWHSISPFFHPPIFFHWIESFDVHRFWYLFFIQMPNTHSRK